ncbi:MAG: GIY-YIG nuclease family protein [Ignavibacteriales bacterium]|nr:GIY-YIG nuclease family protein [Ignavibacteriales bacterium]
MVEQGRGKNRHSLHRGTHQPHVLRQRLFRPHQKPQVTRCYCYIVECADGTYYTGWAIDPEKRVKIHNRGAAQSTRRCACR